MTNLTKLEIRNEYVLDTYGKDFTVATTTKGRTYLAETDTGEIVGRGYTSEALALEALGKIEYRRAAGNLFGYRYGGKIDTDTLRGYNKKTWGNLFRIGGIRFDKAHYWVGKVECTETGTESEEIRLDYFLSYARIPAGLETVANTARATELGARV